MKLQIIGDRESHIQRAALVLLVSYLTQAPDRVPPEVEGMLRYADGDLPTPDDILTMINRLDGGAFCLSNEASAMMLKFEQAMVIAGEMEIAEQPSQDDEQDTTF